METTVRRVLATYPLRNIFNADEGGLYFRLMPNRHYRIGSYSLVKSSNRRGTKHMQCKTRITQMYCCNADGSIKIPIFSIGLIKNPHPFKKLTEAVKVKLKTLYRHQKSAWMDTTLCQHWVDNVFTKYVRRYIEGPVVILWDNFSAHLKVTPLDPDIMLLTSQWTKASYPRLNGDTVLVS
jgi:hypothetical protein